MSENMRAQERAGLRGGGRWDGTSDANLSQNHPFSPKLGLDTFSQQMGSPGRYFDFMIL